jgi:hypothetical protein
MTPGESDRRLSDEEVRFVLRRATEIDEQRSLPEVVGRSLTLAELQEVAGEVGIRAESVQAAIAELDAQPGEEPRSWLGPATSWNEVRAVGGALSDADQRALVRIIERRLKMSGSLSDALGSVRWRATRSQLTTEVDFTASDVETFIKVHEHYPRAERALLQLIPGAYGFVLAVSLAAPQGLSGLALAALSAAGAVLAAGLGRGVWHLVARSSRRRVIRLADELAGAAAGLRQLAGTEPDDGPGSSAE